MTAQAFKTALQEPESNASDVKLHGLIAAGGVGGRGMATVAGHYLEAFCNNQSSLSRRRWTGIALAVMLDASHSVVEKIKEMSAGMQRLGEVILNSNEPEEMKIVAGLIMRQAIEKGIYFECFWKPNEAKTRAEQFPTGSAPRWMAKFQDFLDDLTDLVETNPLTDPCILYPISLTASDGFKWVDSKDEVPVVIVQNDQVTIIAPGPSARDIHFVEIPTKHIKSTRSQPSTLHASQSQTLEHDPCDLTLTLQFEPWTYMLNAEKRTATELTLLFQHSRDAQECENSIKDIQQNDGSAFKNPNTLLRSGELMVKSRSRSPVIPGKRDQSSSDQIGKTPAANCDKLQMKDSASNSLEFGDPKIGNVSDQTALDTNQRQLGGVPGQEHIKNRKRKIEARTNQIQPATSKMPDEIAQSTSSSGTGASLSTGSKHVASTKGKLPKVSQKAKNKVSQLLQEPGDVFALHRESHRKLLSKGQSTAKVKLDGKSTPQSQSNTKPRQLRSTKIPSDCGDDSYSPSKAKVAKKFGGKRKPGALPAGVAKQPSKKKGAKRLTVIKRLPDQVNTPLLPVAPSRVPLIGALLGSQASANTSNSPFKKPLLPTQAPQFPSTPTQHRSKMQPEPLTPTDVRKRPNASAQRVPSSPPVQYIFGTDDDITLGNCADTMILSSNSKPVPASPNADSTAISGHADCEDVDFEKQKGDLQTAKSDPFKQRRDGHKKTSFIRRLTGDDVDDIESDSAVAISYTEMNASISSNHEDSLNQIDGEANLFPKIYSKRSLDSAEVTKSIQRPSATQGEIHHFTPPFNKKPGGNGWTYNQQSKQPCKRNAEEDIQTAGSGPGEKTKRHRAGFGEPTRPQGITISSSPIQRKINAGSNGSVSVTRKDEDEVDFEGDTTLVNLETMEQLDKGFKASPLYFRSSPPFAGSSSSHSSTPDRAELPALASTDAEEMEWEASLEPHQRSLHDLLIRVSRQILRHIIDKETAVTDIAKVFASDGDYLLNQVVQRHQRQSAELWKDMEHKKRVLAREMESAARELVKQRKKVSNLGLST